MADFLNAFAQGWGNAQQAADDYRRNVAMNALAKIYGPVSGDPQAAILNEKYQQDKQMDPLLVQQQQAVNEGLTAKNNYLAQAYPEQLTGLQLNNEGQRLQNTGQDLSNQQGQQKVQAGDITLADAQAQQRRAGLQTLVGGLKASLANGADPATAFDAALPHVEELTGSKIDPATAADMRAKFLADPQGELAQIQGQLDAAATGTLTPLDKAKVQTEQARLATEQSKVPLNQARTDQATAAANVSKSKLTKSLYGAPGDIDKQITAAQFMNQRVSQLVDPQPTADGKGTNPPVFAQMYNLLPKMSTSAPVRIANSYIPGTPEYQFKQLADQASHNFSLDDLRMLKESGVSLGRTTNTEFLASAKALGNLDLGQNSNSLKSQLDSVYGTYRNLADDGAAQIQKLKDNKAAADAANNSLKSGIAPNGVPGDASSPAQPGTSAPNGQAPGGAGSRNPATVPAGDQSQIRVPAVNSPQGVAAATLTPAGQGRVQGTITLGDQTYDFASGGRNRGNVPYGTYPIGNFTSGEQRAATGHSYTKDAFPVLGELPDPRYPNQPRAGILLHQSSQNDVNKVLTSGCLGIPASEWPAFKDALIKTQKTYGNLVLQVTPSGVSIIPAKDATRMVKQDVNTFTKKANTILPDSVKQQQVALPPTGPHGSPDVAANTQLRGSLMPPMPKGAEDVQPTTQGQQQQQAAAPAPQRQQEQRGAPPVVVDQSAFMPPQQQQQAPKFEQALSDNDLLAKYGVKL